MIIERKIHHFESINYQAIIDGIYHELKDLDLGGKVADYIPELAYPSDQPRLVEKGIFI